MNTAETIEQVPGDLSGVTYMKDEDYHSHPALSQSGMKTLLQEGGPAKYRQQMDGPREYKDAFDFGHAAHRHVLTEGADIAVLDFKDRRTNDYKAAAAEARAADRIPVLIKDLAKVEAMAKVIREHPTAQAVLAGALPERKLFWTDERTGVPLRAMVDSLPTAAPMVIGDYKTARDASRAVFQRSVLTYGYVIQDPMYREAVRANGLDPDPAFVFIVQETSAPYLVATYELDDAARTEGEALMRRAIDLFARCTEAGHWPGYSPRIEPLSLPPWYRPGAHLTDPDDIEGDTAA